MEKLSHEELSRLVADGPAPLTNWLHIKSGKSYIVLNTALLESTLKPVVIYCGIHNGGHQGVSWVRPLAEFLSKFAPYPSNGV